MRRRYAFLAGGGVLAAMLVVGVGFWANQPSISKIQNVPQNVKGAETPDYTLKPISNAYFTTQVPIRFVGGKSNVGTGKPLLLQQLFTAQSATRGLYADQLAVTVGLLPAGALSEVSGVQLRSRSTAYTALTYPWLTKGLAYESEQNGYELSVFVPHATYYVAIVLSGQVDKKTQLDHEMQLIITSFNWQ